MRIGIHIDHAQLGRALQQSLQAITDPRSTLFRQVALDLIPVLHQRIHVDGEDADGKPIGRYTNAYMKTRAKKNRTADTKVIVSLTRQLENDYAVIATDRGWGIGFLNSHNADKAGWVEETYKRKIFELSPAELQIAVSRVQELINTELNI